MNKLIVVFVTLLATYGCRKNGDLPAAPFLVTVSDNAPRGEILFAPFKGGNQSGTIYILDQKGGIIKQKNTAGITMDFKRWEIDGKVRYTYLVEDRTGYRIPGFNAYIPGYYVIADASLEELKRVFLLTDQLEDDSQTLLDGHDFILLDDHHYLTIGYYERYITGDTPLFISGQRARIVDAIIQEVKNDQLIWQWKSTDHPELYENSREGNNFKDSVNIQDYAHINSMFIDPSDNNLICSFRNLDQVLKISRTSGEIIWKLGGRNSDFPLTDEQYFLRQHHATITGNKLMLFDNGETRSRNKTRVLEFGLDQNTKTITSFSAFDVVAPFAAYMGSVVKHGDYYFIGGGSGNYMLEVNAVTGKKVFEMSLGDSSTYRAFKYYK